MAASTKKRPRRYHTPGVVSGSLARELNHQELERRLETSGQLDFDQQYRRRKETEAELIARQRARPKAAVPEGVPGGGAGVRGGVGADSPAAAVLR